MKYTQPFGISDPNAGYQDGDLILGIDGSIPPAQAIEDPQRELDHLITFAGLTPTNGDLQQVRKAVQAMVGPQLAALKSIQNVQKFNTSTRVSMSTAGANVKVTGWSGFNYTKKSPTSLLLVWGDFICRSPGASGCTLFDLNIGPSSTAFTGSNAITGTAIKNTLVQSIAGLPAGTHACSIGFYRNDATSWTTVFNPTNSDESGYATVPNATLIFAEVEP